MGKDCDPRIDLQHPSGKYDNLNHVSDHRLSKNEQQNTNPMFFPVYSNPYGCAFTGNGTVAFPGFRAEKFYQLTSGSIPVSVTSGLAAAQRSYLVFDRSGNQTNLIFSSASPPVLNTNLIDRHVDLLGSNETDVSYENGSTEMHEDTAEIDALLYSDTYELLDEEEASTGHSPSEAAGITDEVATSFVPAKRKRLNKELDTSLTDTASSALLHHPEPHSWHNLEAGDESSFVKGINPRAVGEIDPSMPTTAVIPKSKRAKRERIRETVGVLTRIIPGGKGKDAVTVLDDAIRYLRSLKLKAKAMGATHL